MADINLSKAVRSNLSSLQNTATLMAKTQDRLSTGNKVNSALDNPTNFFTAASLNSRAGDLNNLMDSMANGIKTIEAADNGLSAITKNLESMQSTLRQARQDKSFQTASFTVDAAATGNLTISGGAVGAAAESLNLQKSVVTGNGGFAGPNGTAQAGGTLQISATGLGGGSSVNVTYNKGDDARGVAQKINDAMSTAAGGGDVRATVKNGQLELSNAKNNAITVAGGQAVGLTQGGAATVVSSKATGTAAPAAAAGYTGGTLTVAGVNITLTPGVAGGSADTALTNGARAASEINAGLLAAGVSGYSASSNVTTGVVTVERADGETFAVSGTAAAQLNLPATASGGTTALGAVTAPVSQSVAKSADDLVADIASNFNLDGKVRASNDNGKLRIENLSTQTLKIGGASGGVVNGGATAKSDISGNAVRADLANQFNELRDQLDKLSDDASFNGINLLRGDKLTITFNETGNSSIEVQTKGEKSVNAANLKLSTTLTAKDLDSDNGIDNFLNEVKGALNSVRSQASAFGSNLSIVQNRQDFTKSMINTLETGAGNLTLADMNQEAANMMALQTRQSLASSTLSMANQADQGVLQLLR